MLKLRIILLSKYLYYIIFILSLLFGIYKTKIVKYYSLYQDTFDENAIVTNYQIDGDKLSLTLKAKEKIKATYYFKSLEEKNYYLSNLKYGTELYINGELNEPLNNTIPNTFNYKKYLYNKKIYKQLNIDKIDILNNKISILDNIKNYLKQRISKIDKKGYINTFVLGDKFDITEETFATYQKNGVTHLFAISGMHIALFSSILLSFLKKLKLDEDKRLFIVIFILLFYSILTGFPASVTRAFTFFTLITLNKIFYTNIKTIYILILTISIILFINPFLIYDIGFLYSSTTTLGLILFSDKLNSKNKIQTLLMVSIIAQLFSLPITINNFYTINIFSIVANIIIVPLVSTIIYPMSLLTLIFPFIYPILNILIYLLELFSKILSSIDILTITIPKLPIYFIVIYYLFLYLFYLKDKSRYLLFIIFLILINKYKYIFDNNGYVYFLDVGQGDSALIISPHYKDIVLIDTGGLISSTKEPWQEKNKTYNISDTTILFMKSIGITHIDEMILSHGDADHCGEALNITKQIFVKNITFNKGQKVYLESRLKDNNIQHNYQNMQLTNLEHDEYNDENKDSLFTYITIYNTNFLFSGDANKEQELEVLNKYNIKPNIIKLGHHGSKTSSDYSYLKILSPDISIISSGRNNRFNHPSIETINTLNILNLSYLNTQTSGTIKFIIFKNSYTFLEYKP